MLTLPAKITNVVIVNLKLRKYRPKKDGLFPIYIRITRNCKSSWLSVNVSVKAKEWDEVKGKVRPGHPNSARVNACLKQVKLKYQNDIMEIARTAAGKLIITIKKAGQEKKYTIKEGATQKIEL